MSRRFIIIAIIGLIILAGIGASLYFVSNKNQTKSTASKPLQIKKIVDNQVVAPIPTLKNDAIWFFDNESRLYRANTDGTGLSEYSLPSLNGIIKSALWAPTGTDFLAVANIQGDSGAPTESKIYYDTNAKIYIYLSPNIQSIDWLPDNQRVVYIWKSSDNVHQSLVISNADGNGYKTITDVFWPDLQVKASPDGKSVLLYRKNIQGDTNKIYSVDLTSGQISTLVSIGKNTGAAWVPGSNKFIYSQDTGSAYPKLFSFDATSKLATDLNLNTNLAKTAATSDGKYLFVAVPKKDNSGDTFIKMDLTTTKQDPYFDPPTSVHATGLFLLGNTLYYVNSTDGKLYDIES